MKQTLTLFAALVLLAVGATAQKLSYSAVVRNSANELQANKTLTVGVSIANNATGNPAVYSETHSGVQTNQNGLLTLTIGEGTNVSGNLTQVTWPSAYITTTYTIDGSTVTNTVAVNAVPYALYAENSGTSTPVNDGVLTITMPDGTTKTFTANQLGNTNVTIPAAPTVNDGTLTIKQGENTLGTFSANQSGTTNVNIPAAPTVNDGTLTITTSNGTSTFTANQSGTTDVTIPTYTLTAGDLINVINNMTAEEKARMCAALAALGCSGTEPTPPTPDCPTLGATTIVPSDYPEPGVTPPTTYLEIETVINDYDENLVNPATAKFVITYTTESMTEPITTTVDNANASGAIMVDDGVMRYYFEEQQVVISMTVTPSIALAGACATPAMITGEPGTYSLACPFIIDDNTTVTPDPNNSDVMVIHAEIGNYNLGMISVENSGVKINNANGVGIDMLVAGAHPDSIEISTTGVMTATIDCANYGTTFYVVPFIASYCSDGEILENFTDVEGTPVEVTMTTPTPTTPVDGQPCPGAATVTDHEGNVYNTVQIGNQCWTKENMRCTTSPSTGKYIVNNTSDQYTYTGKMAKWYKNDSVAAVTAGYGLLYNWNAAVDTFNVDYTETDVNTNSSNAVSVTFAGHRRGICPEGWHVPSYAEWTDLTNYLDSCRNEAGQYKYRCNQSGSIAKALASTTGWITNGATEDSPCELRYNPATTNNASGFGAVPAGTFASDFSGAGGNTSICSATQTGSYNAHHRYLSYGSASVYSYSGVTYSGYSVRCLKN